jgi:hypothetical protein
MKRSLFIAALGGISMFAHVTISTKITWSREVSRIVYQRCLSCHREGGSSFALETYEQARPWAKAIQEEVLTRRMPPWGAVKGFGEFAHDQGLTQEEVNLIAEWAEGGAPEGDPNLLPPKPTKFEAAPKPQGRSISAPVRLKSPVTLTGFQASGPMRVTAKLPDGSVEPLLWIMTQLKQPLDFVLAKPLSLPAGAKITSTQPVTAFVKAPSRPRRTAPSLPGPRAQTAPTSDAAPASGRSH